MSTKDDALIKAMDEAFWAPHPTNSTLLDSMRSALAVARKAILEEAIKACAAEHLDEPDPNDHGDAAYDRGVRDCVTAVRSLATQEQHNG